MQVLGHDLKCTSYHEIIVKILFKRIELAEITLVAQRKQIQLGTMRFRVQSLAWLSGLRIQCCHELWCRSQTGLGSGIAVAVAPPNT